ncbi:MAG: tetratricopeptide repeat protein [Bacteroidota bacterium]|nr:tetratricopeptide repeat protein [Bacteroidota bacterium]
MKIISRYSFILIVSGFVFLSCSSTKKTITATINPASPVKEAAIEDTRKQEFEYYLVEGIKQKNFGRQDAATELFTKCLTLDPQSATALFELANIQIAKGDLTNAATGLEKAVAISPDNQWYKYLLAQVYQQTSQFDKASVLFNQLVEKNPDNIDYLYLYGGALANSGKGKEALDVFNQLESKTGITDQLSLAKEQIYLKEGKNQKAIEELEKLIKSSPDEPRYYGLLADLYLQLENKVKALELYHKVLQIDPDNGFVLFSLANYYALDKNNQKAFEYALKGFSNPSSELEVKINYLLLIHNDRSKYNFTDQQIDELAAKIIVAQPLEEQAYAFYADYLIQSKRSNQAIDVIRKGIAVSPKSYALWEKLLLAEADLQDQTALSTDTEKAIALFPDEPMVNLLRSASLLMEGKSKEALTALDNGQKFIGDNKALQIQFELQRAELYYKTNRSKEAFESFDKVLKIDPNNQMALNNYAYYLSVQNQDLEKAEKMASTVVQNNPTNATFLDTYAWVLFKRQNYSLAKFYMESALSNGGNDNATLLEHYGDILFMNGDKEKALEYWKKSAEKGPASDLLKKKIKEGKYLEN